MFFRVKMLKYTHFYIFRLILFCCCGTLILFWEGVWKLKHSLYYVQYIYIDLLIPIHVFKRVISKNVLTRFGRKTKPGNTNATISAAVETRCSKELKRLYIRFVFREENVRLGTFPRCSLPAFILRPLHTCIFYCD